MVVGDDVDLAPPLPQVGRLARERHEVRGDGDVGVRPDRVALGDEARPELVVAEPCEVETLGGVDHARRGGGQPDLLPVAVALAPERGAPPGVELVEGAVARTQPVAERVQSVLGVVLRDGHAVLVVHVPERERGVGPVALGERTRDPGGRSPVGGRARGDHAARAEPEGDTVARDDPRVGVRPVEPGGRYGGRGAQDDADAVGVEEIHEPVEPGEVEHALLGLDQDPREHADGREGDPGLAHQGDVLGPDVLGPLLGVVVAAVGDPVETLRPDADGRRVGAGTGRCGRRGGAGCGVVGHDAPSGRGRRGSGRPSRSTVNAHSIDRTKDRWEPVTFPD